jgi:hypothetical protein
MSRPDALCSLQVSVDQLPLNKYIPTINLCIFEVFGLYPRLGEYIWTSDRETVLVTT